MTKEIDRLTKTLEEKEKEINALLYRVNLPVEKEIAREEIDPSLLSIKGEYTKI